MKQEILTGIGFLLVASSVAFAQNAPTAAGNTATAVVPPPSSPAAAKAGGAQVDGASLQQTLADNLKKAGYTDVEIWPDAFIVEAKNKAGAPTMMFLTPELDDRLHRPGCAWSGHPDSHRRRANQAVTTGLPRPVHADQRGLKRALPHCCYACCTVHEAASGA